MQAYVLILFLLLGWLFQQAAYATEDQSDSHAHEHAEKHTEKHGTHGDAPAHEQHGHHEEQVTRIDAAMASQVRIETASALSRVLHQRIVAYGSLSTGPEQLSHVRARYTGMIKSVKLTIGDYTKRGDLLAEVESNESLKTYQILAPISGTIIQRHANTGEVTQDQVLFSIANFDTLWAEFRIYPSQQPLVNAGQAVRIMVNEWVLDGAIQHIIPALDKPYQLARVTFDNRSKGLSPGLLAEGHIVIDEFTANLAVEKTAIQTLNEQAGVFVKQGDKYTFTPLQLGRSDDRYAEVLSGISSGQVYVSNNSYLIKADIEKSAAEHEH